MKPSHGVIEKLDSHQSEALLEKATFGHLACQAHGELYLVPITCIFENGYLYSHSRAGKKIEMMRQHPQVCVQFEEVRTFFNWKSVIIWGHFEELRGDQASMAMRSLILRMKDQYSGRRESDLKIDFAAQLESAIIYRIKIERMSGRCEKMAP